MPGDDYASIGGGSLRLKGVKGSKVDKHKKKKSKKHVQDASPTGAFNTKAAEDDVAPEHEQNRPDDDAASTSALRDAKEDSTEIDGAMRSSTKTAAEIRHEERRRKMLDERLKREGVKTHKERVEELNKYLSGLSEHHDMPKIGPG